LIHRNVIQSVRGVLSAVSALLLMASAASAQVTPMEYPKPAAEQPTTATVTPISHVVSKPVAAEPKPAAPVAAATPTPTPAPAAVQVPATDPYGFTNWLNATRAQYGLPAVGYDPNLEGWAAVNNSHQNSRGLGHFVMGPARRQNSAMGHYTAIGSMWMASPAHRAALLDPTISFIGIAGAGAYWTFNAY
jgi:uncharacterized protein YkwD